MWWVLQAVVALAVVFSNIYFEWTPNGYLAAIIAWGAAYFASFLLSSAIDWLRVKPRQSSVNKDGLGDARWRLPRQ